MPELERYVLALLAKLDATLRQAVDDFDFNTYTRALVDFCNEDLSAFYFDIRKDSLYCDAADDPKRMACRTVLDTLFHALVRYAAPVLVFTSEEVWGTRFPGEGSVHLLEWPEVPANTTRHPGEGRGPTDLSASPQGQLDPGLRRDDELVGKWDILRELRNKVTEAIEPLRRDKVIGSSLEAEVVIWHPLVPDDEDSDDFDEQRKLISDLLITDLGKVHLTNLTLEIGGSGRPYSLVEMDDGQILVRRTAHHKCGRCWRHLPEVTEDGALCSRCDQVVAAMDAVA